MSFQFTEKEIRVDLTVKNKLSGPAQSHENETISKNPIIDQHS